MLVLDEPVAMYSENLDKSGNFQFNLADSYGIGKDYVIQPAGILKDEHKLEVFH